MKGLNPSILAIGMALGLVGCAELGAPPSQAAPNAKAATPRPTPQAPRVPTHQDKVAAIRVSRLVPKPILNQDENEVYWALRKLLEKNGLRLYIHPQVNLGTAFKTPEDQEGKLARSAIECKRADFCIVDGSRRPVAFVEYHGAGHYGNSPKDRANAMERDEIKRVACEAADVIYHEIQREDMKNLEAHLRERLLPELLQHPHGLAYNTA